ncbi:MAG: hypothetical protein ACRDJ0_09935 [Actinomycetota bacterium]
MYDIQGTRISVRTTSARFGHWLDYALAAYKTDPGDEEWFDDYSLVVPNFDASSKRREFCILYHGSVPKIRTLDPVTFGRSLVEELEANLYAERDDAVYLQALAMEVDGAYVLVPSYLAPSLGRFGRNLDRSGVRLARSTNVTLTPAGQTALPTPLLDLPNDAYERLARLRPAHIAPDRLAPKERRKVDAVFIHDQAEAALREVTRGHATHTLAAAVVNLRRIPGTVLESVAQLVAGTRCYSIGWSDARTTLDAILSGARSSSEALSPNRDNEESP